MNSKKARSREYRTKSGSTSKQVPVRIMVTQADFERIKALERDHITSREEIFQRGLQSCNNR
ncbi:MAG: hypothetical protein ACLRRI_01930 [Oscillospiraceae bacterium]